jgi:hypothetical protein
VQHLADLPSVEKKGMMMMGPPVAVAFRYNYCALLVLCAAMISYNCFFNNNKK